MSWKAVDRYSKDYIELQTKDKVKFYKTPDSVLQTQLTAYDAAAEKKVAGNAMFKEIADSQKAFAERACAGTSIPMSAGAWPTTITSAQDGRGKEGLKGFIVNHQPSGEVRVADFI